MDKHLTAFLHIGDKFMPRSFATLPRVGEIISAGIYGKLAVVRVEYDEESDPHLYLAPMEEAARPSETILIVDAESAHLKLAQVMLTAEGYDVRTAMDTEQALGVLAAYRPRLILMDVYLPGMDGLGFIRRLKGDAATRDILIVAVTSHTVEASEERARAVGCDDYVTKPIDTTALPLRLAILLAHAGRPGRSAGTGGPETAP